MPVSVQQEVVDIDVHDGTPMYGNNMLCIPLWCGCQMLTCYLWPHRATWSPTTPVDWRQWLMQYWRLMLPATVMVIQQTFPRTCHWAAIFLSRLSCWATELLVSSCIKQRTSGILSQPRTVYKPLFWVYHFTSSELSNTTLSLDLFYTVVSYY